MAEKASEGRTWSEIYGGGGARSPEGSPPLPPPDSRGGESDPKIGAGSGRLASEGGFCEICTHQDGWCVVKVRRKVSGKKRWQTACFFILWDKVGEAVLAEINGVLSRFPHKAGWSDRLEMRRHNRLSASDAERIEEACTAIAEFGWR